MDDNQLNSLAVKSGNGCVESSTEILRHFIPIVERMGREVWHLLRDESSFTNECYRKLLKVAARFDPNGGRSFRNYAIHKLKGIRSTHIKRRSIQRDLLTSIEALAGGDADGKKKYQFRDELALVDDGLITQEKIALLAEDDSRRLAILSAWTNGDYNDSHTASVLADRHGGNAESHRKYINRFRTTCRRALA